MAARRLARLIALALLGAAACAHRAAAPDAAARDPAGVAQRRIVLDPIVVTAGKPDDPAIETKTDLQLFDDGAVYFRNGDFTRAAAHFDRIVSAFPRSPQYLVALYNAGLSHERLGHFTEALDRFEVVLKRSPAGGDAVDATFHAALAEYRLGRLPAAAQRLHALSEQPGLAPQRKGEALMQEGVCRFESGARSEGEHLFRAAIAVFEKELGSGEVDSALPAQAEFWLGEVYRSYFRDAQLDPTTMDEKKLTAAMETKAEFLLSAQGHYLRSIRKGNGEWATASGFRIGELYEAFHDQLLGAPLPAGLDEEQAQLYRDELRNKVRVLMTGICGTDLHIFEWDEWARVTIPVPLVIGHEFVGEIVEVGANVNDFHPGELVSGEGHVTCGRCRNCLAGRRHLCAHSQGVGVNRAGAFAEYVVLPMSNIWKHNPKVPLEIAAIFDPFGNAVHTALSFPVLGEDVLITGAGPIGIMAAAVVRHAGARFVVITDVNPYRLALAEKIGVNLAVDSSKRQLADVQKELGMHEGFDVGLEMSGNAAAFRDMLANMSHGGKIAMLGIPATEMAINWRHVIFNMLTIKGIYGREMYETWYKMTVMLESGLDISPVITHRFAYSEFQQGFDAMRSGKSGKVLLDWRKVS